MLEEVIRELTVRNNNEQTTSEGILVWAKRVDAQRAQAAILNDVTEFCQFDKIKIAPRAKGSQTDTEHNIQQMAMQILWQDTCVSTVPSIWEDVHWIWEDGPLQKGVQNQEGLCSA